MSEKDNLDLMIVKTCQRVEEAHRRIDQLDALYREGSRTLAALSQMMDRAGARYDNELSNISGKFTRLYDHDLKSMDESLDTLIEFKDNMKGFARVVGFLSVLVGLIWSLLKFKTD